MRRAALIAPLLAALLSSCGDDGGNAPCETDDDCRSLGSRCEPSRVCGATCDDAICRELGARYECTFRNGRCHQVACSASIPCLDEKLICDAYVPRCVPPTGECTSVADCPVFDARIMDTATRSCDADVGLCRLDARSELGGPWDYLPPVVVERPEPGDTFATTADVEFRWQQTRSPVLLLVVKDLSSGYSDVRDNAIWGFSRTPQEPTTATWADGTAVGREGWVGAPPLPPDGPLYLTVLEVSQGAVVAASDFIPFRIGATSWAIPGSLCADEGELPGSCTHPSSPMICLEGACRRLCLSARDCDATEVCSDVIGGVRTCRTR